MQQTFIYRDGTRPYPPRSMADKVDKIQIKESGNIVVTQSPTKHAPPKNREGVQQPFRSTPGCWTPFRVGFNFKSARTEQRNEEEAFSRFSLESQIM